MAKKLPKAVLWYDSFVPEQLQLFRDLQKSTCLEVTGHDINSFPVDASVPRLFHPDGCQYVTESSIREVAHC